MDRFEKANEKKKEQLGKAIGTASGQFKKGKEV